MKINIQAPIALESKLLIQAITKKIKAFAKDHKAVNEVDIKLKQDISTGKKVSEIYLKMSGKNIFAIENGRTFEIATDKTISKLQNQINKNILKPEPEEENTHIELTE